jgi:ferredoxin
VSEVLEVRIDRRKCRGVGQCALRAPATFGLDDDGKGVVLGSQDDAREVIVAAARSCPSFAISVRSGDRELA